MKSEQDFDNKTPKSKFKSVLKKFEDKVNDDKKIDEHEVTDDARNPKNPKNSDKLKINLVNNFKSLGESWKGRFMETQLPSSVRKKRKSAAACARGGQYVDKIRPSDMSGSENGFQKRKNEKRKCNLIEENVKISDYFSPGKLPKLTNFNFSSRLGSDPGMGGQCDGCWTEKEKGFLEKK